MYREIIGINMSYGLKVNPFANTNVQEIRERYSNNPFVKGANGVNSSGGVGGPIGTTEVVDNVNYSAPKADKSLAYKGFYAALYGQPNYNGQKLDILQA